jgi:ABC-type lipoprotein export system ATPase subunit
MQAFTDSPELASRPEAPLIQVEHLSRVISTKEPPVVILNDLTFNIYNPCLFAINGPSGSGKSTLLNMLTGVDRPTSGRVLFAGEELQAKSEDALARWRGRHVGIIFQFFQLIPTLTVLENILLALELGASRPRQEWVKWAQVCLQSVSMQDLSGRLPSELSGGQQQRVAIARALANDPPVLIADEPTGNLDSRSAGQIFEILAILARQGKTVVYVTHDPRLAAQADARLDLLDGRMVAFENLHPSIASEGVRIQAKEGQA